MFSTLRNRFGIPGVISVIALVFAMFGGAYAASNSSSGGKATASAKAKKGPRGPKGPKGDIGPAGPIGLTGPAGANGKDGTNGTNGGNGAGATTESFGGEAHGCKEGGVVVKSASPEVAVCNGKKGTQGLPGPTCVNGECLLPSGATETGTWAVRGKGLEQVMTAISFPLGLTETPQPIFVTQAEAHGTSGPPICPGTYEEPKSDPAAEEIGEPVLCLYERLMVNLEEPQQFLGAATGVPLNSHWSMKRTKRLASGAGR